MAIRVTVRPHPKSHPFNEREVVVQPNTEPLKVGRSVAKFRPAPANLIFDCKVLSRTHAVIWVEDGQLYIKDTKSSNGTFVNCHRLSRSGEESSPALLNDGDVVQFGVDVTEVQSKRVVHGCITATFHCSPLSQPKSESPSTDDLVDVPIQDVNELAQILLEARHHQDLLEAKLASVQRDIDVSTTGMDLSMKGFIEEDRLQGRIDTLESQLQFYMQDRGQTELQEKLAQKEKELRQCEQKAKEALHQVLQEKLTLATNLASVQRDYDQSEQECDRMKSLFEDSQREMEELKRGHQERLDEMEQLRSQLESAKERHSSLEEETRAKDAHLQEKLESTKSEVVTLRSSKTSITDEVEKLKASVEELKAKNANLDSQINTFEREGDDKAGRTLIEVDEHQRADSSESLNDKAISLEAELSAARQECHDLSAKRSCLEGQLGELQSVIAGQKTQIRTLEEHVRSKTADITALKSRLESASPSQAKHTSSEHLNKGSSDNNIFLNGHLSLSTSDLSNSFAERIHENDRQMSEPNVHLHSDSAELLSTSGQLKTLPVPSPHSSGNVSPLRMNLEACKHLIARLQREAQELELNKQKVEQVYKSERQGWIGERELLQQRIGNASTGQQQLHTELELAKADLQAARQSLQDQEDKFKTLVKVEEKKEWTVSLRTLFYTTLIIALFTSLFPWISGCNST